MKERPILFSAPMVRALLDGTKTQTRRIFKQAVGLSLSVDMDDEAPGVAELSWLWGDGPGHEVNETIKRVACPYGQPGDRLWVRETWGLHAYGDDTDWQKGSCTAMNLDDSVIAYRADWGPIQGSCHWRPSIHMPRAASRITLEIAGVRVERLQDISDGDLSAEGIQELIDAGVDHDGTPRDTYRTLWENLNGPGSWDAHPWVWVVNFNLSNKGGNHAR